MEVLRQVARLSRPVFLLLAALGYILGAGIAKYLGIPVDPTVLFVGLLSVILAQMSMSLLGIVFEPASELSSEITAPEIRREARNTALYVSLGSLASVVMMGFAIHAASKLSAAAAVCLALLVIVPLIYAVPPLRALDRGFSELLLAIEVSYLSPSAGFLLQARNHHALLVVCIIAMTLLQGATLIALGFASYAEDLRLGRSTLLTRVGWKNALTVHDSLMIAAYAMLAYGVIAGFSFGVLAPAFLTIPFAILQVLQLRRIAMGDRPLWRLLHVNAVAIYGLSVYFLALSFWLR